MGAELAVRGPKVEAARAGIRAVTGYGEGHVDVGEEQICRRDRDDGECRHGTEDPREPTEPAPQARLDGRLRLRPLARDLGRFHGAPPAAAMACIVSESPAEIEA